MTIVVSTSAEAQNIKDNPLLQEWNTPHQTPPFGLIKNSHYAPAMRYAIEQSRNNVKAVANNKETPTFENTIVALETAEEMLERISSLLFNLNECNTDPEMQSIVMELSPELARYSNEVYMDEKLFARVKSLYDNKESLPYTPEQLQVLEKYYQRFVRNGVNLNKKDKKIFARNAEELVTLSEQFNQNVLADNNAFVLHITDRADLAGLPENVIEAARAEAASRRKEGWVFTLAYPSYGPFMRFADNRALREQMWRAYNSRGNHGDANDNNEIIRRMTALRYEQARLLGYNNYVEYSLSNTMAQTEQTVSDFMRKLIEACYPVAVEDLKEVTEYAKSIGSNFALQQWDFSYYSEKLKQQKYSFDAELLRPYFQLERVRQGIFDLYNTLYGLTFKESKDIPVYNPDVRVFEIYDGSRFMGVLYLDMFPRDNKRSGAWMTEFRVQSNIGGRQVRPLIQVVCNFSKPVGEKPSLLSFDEVETFMHEFGHAMHGMLSDVTYPSVSGTSVRHDFVEMPSQVMENWCYEPSFINTFAKHYITGDTMPAEYIEKIRRSENFLAGWLCLRQLNLGMTDMAFHSLTSPMEGRADEFEHKHMIMLLPEIEGTCTATSFTHIFAGGYAAGYYGYKWAEVLDADIFSKFKANGIFDKATAEAFRREILSKGGSEHPSVLFRNFMGRDPNTEALLLRCGFIQQLELPTPPKGGIK